MNFINHIKIFLRLIKYKVSATVAFTTIPGYVLFTHKLDLNLVLIILGVYALASAATVLNQVQERKYDALMERTSCRPLPKNELSISNALRIFIILLVAGSVLLYKYGGIVPLLLGLFNILWYNGVYTYLKRITAFAVVPGSIIGAVPPMIGWTAAGGTIFSSEIMALGFFLFIWQVPHFWLLMVRYDKDYKKAGYPVLSNLLSVIQIKNITTAWIFATAASLCIFPIYNIIHSFWAIIAVFIISFTLLVWASLVVIKEERKHLTLTTFIIINVGMLLTMLIVIIDAFVIST